MIYRYDNFVKLFEGELKVINRIREVREKLGLSQVELSRRAHIASPNLSAIEHGERKAWPKARRRLARALKCPESYLFPENGGHDAE